MDINELVGLDSGLLLLILFSLLVAKSLLPFFPLPKESVMIVMGSQFGLITGSLVNFSGLFLGALITYEISLSGRYAFDRRSTRLIHYQEKINQHGWKALVPLRFSPITAQDVTSYASGLARLTRNNYYVISGLAFILYGIFFSWIGSAI